MRSLRVRIYTKGRAYLLILRLLGDVHREMTQRDLHVEDSRDGMRDQKVARARPSTLNNSISHTTVGRGQLFCVNIKTEPPQIHCETPTEKNTALLQVLQKRQNAQ